MNNKKKQNTTKLTQFELFMFIKRMQLCFDIDNFEKIKEWNGKSIEELINNLTDGDIYFFYSFVEYIESLNKSEEAKKAINNAENDFDKKLLKLKYYLKYAYKFSKEFPEEQEIVLNVYQNIVMLESKKNEA